MAHGHHRTLFPAGAAAFFLFFCSTAFADVLYLKSGQVVRGQVTEIKDGIYTFKDGMDGSETQISEDNISIADIDPSNPAAKSHVIFFSETAHESKASSDEDTAGRQTVVVAPPGDPTDDFKKKGDVLKYAQDPVKLSNERTAQVQKNVEELKKIADGANAPSQ